MKTRSLQINNKDSSSCCNELSCKNECHLYFYLVLSIVISSLLMIPSWIRWFTVEYSIIQNEFDFFIGLIKNDEGVASLRMVYYGRILYAILMLILGFIFFKTTRIILEHKIPENVQTRIILLTIMMAVVFLTGQPFISSDVFYYLGKGWQNAHYHLNPSLYSINQIPGFEQDEMFQNIYPMFFNLKLNYGPIFSQLSSGIASLGNGDIHTTLWLFKLVSFGVFLLTLCFIWNIVGSIGGNQLFSTYLYAGNPLVLFNFLTCNHNDLIMILFLLIAVWFLTTKFNYCSAIPYAFAIATKPSAILIMPAFLLFFLRCHSGKIAFQKLILFSLLLVASLFVLFLYNIDELFVIKGYLTRHSQSLRSSLYLVMVLFDDHFNTNMIGSIAFGPKLLYVFFVLGVFVCFLRGKKMKPIHSFIIFSCFIIFGYLTFVATFVTEWYFTWFICLAVCFMPRRISYGVLLLSCLYMPIVIFSLSGIPWIVYSSQVILYFLLLFSFLYYFCLDMRLLRNETS